MWWITSLFVDSKYRRQGCFKRLYEHARKQAVREGVGGIRVYTTTDNLSAQSTVSLINLLSCVSQSPLLLRQLCISFEPLWRASL